LFIAALIIVLWLVMLVFYLLVSRQQSHLQGQMVSLEELLEESFEEQLDNENGRPLAHPADNHPE
jgi:hypothetical protein